MKTLNIGERTQSCTKYKASTTPPPAHHACSVTYSTVLQPVAYQDPPPFPNGPRMGHHRTPDALSLTAPPSHSRRPPSSVSPLGASALGTLSTLSLWPLALDPAPCLGAQPSSLQAEPSRTPSPHASPLTTSLLALTSLTSGLPPPEVPFCHVPCQPSHCVGPSQST